MFTSQAGALQKYLDAMRKAGAKLPAVPGVEPEVTIDLGDIVTRVTTIKIGTFGQLEHKWGKVVDTYANDDDSPCYRFIEVPDDNFELWSGKHLVYRVKDGQGVWFGSEAIRRLRAKVQVRTSEDGPQGEELSGLMSRHGPDDDCPTRKCTCPPAQTQ